MSLCTHGQGEQQPALSHSVFRVFAAHTHIFMKLYKDVDQVISILPQPNVAFARLQTDSINGTGSLYESQRKKYNFIRKI